MNDVERKIMNIFQRVIKTDEIVINSINIQNNKNYGQISLRSADDSTLIECVEKLSGIQIGDYIELDKVDEIEDVNDEYECKLFIKFSKENIRDYVIKTHRDRDGYGYGNEQEHYSGDDEDEYYERPKNGYGSRNRNRNRNRRRGMTSHRKSNGNLSLFLVIGIGLFILYMYFKK